MTALSADQIAPRTRAKHTRSRLGCAVCRIRRVRCDQTRPTCLKCSSTGRTCEGLSFTNQEKASSSIAPKAVAVAQSVPGRVVTDSWEHHALRYFERNTASQLAGRFEADFWSRLVLQVGSREPSVRHILIALGSLHKALQGADACSSMSTETGDMRKHADAQYTLAIGLLHSHIRLQGTKSLDVILMCCILCTGFDWLRGCSSSARLHLQSGLQALEQWTKSQGSKERGISFSSPQGHLIRNFLVPIFRRFALQAKTFSTAPLPWISLFCHGVNGKFESLREARNSLDALLSHQFLSPDASSKKRDISPLTQWFEALARYRTTSSSDPGSEAQSIILELTYTASRILLATQRVSEMAYDAFVPEFERIVNLTQGLLAHGNASCFSMDMETVPLLYYVALQCRHPIIRRKAVALLAATPRREGMWDSVATVRLAQEAVAIEEEGLEMVVGQNDVPEWRRIASSWSQTNLADRSIMMGFVRQGEDGWSEQRVLYW